mmetsp:Transcript_21451/g.48372  ORF Transcript_21451/g.48372 Transcript_21451/m.48372 type:complete len:203 (-) Transcript_21451:4103-4711(-)
MGLNLFQIRLQLHENFLGRWHLRRHEAPRNCALHGGGDPLSDIVKEVQGQPPDLQGGVGGGLVAEADLLGGATLYRTLSIFHRKIIGERRIGLQDEIVIAPWTRFELASCTRGHARPDLQEQDVRVTRVLLGLLPSWRLEGQMESLLPAWADDRIRWWWQVVKLGGLNVVGHVILILEAGPIEVQVLGLWLVRHVHQHLLTE